MLTISCIIVNYNNEKFLSQCIDSVLNQKKKPDEIIISDDCSTDNSIAILKEYASKYKCIKLILRNKNVGVSINRDEAIRMSKCDLITTLDSDDYYFPDKILNEFELLEKNENSVAYSRLVDIDINGVIYQNRHGKIFKMNHYWFNLYKFLVGSNLYDTKDIMIYKSDYLKLGGLNISVNLSEDWDLRLRFLLSGLQWYYSGSFGTAYRHTFSGLSTNNGVKAKFVKLSFVLKNIKNAKNKFIYILLILLYVSFGWYKIFIKSKIEK